MSCIYLSALLPPFNGTSRFAETAFERHLALAVHNRFPQPSFNLKAQFGSVSQGSVFNQYAKHPLLVCRQISFVRFGIGNPSLRGL